MSDRLVLDVWLRFSEGGASLGMLQAIAEAANEQGNCYLSIDQLAGLARQSRRNALRSVARLRSERWIVTSRILGHGGMLVYQLNLPKLARSIRPRPHTAAVQAQRHRLLGETEASLLERIALRPARCQGGDKDKFGRQDAVGKRAEQPVVAGTTAKNPSGHQRVGSRPVNPPIEGGKAE